MRKILTAGAAAALMSAGLVFGSAIAAHATVCTNPAASGPIANGVQVCTPIGSVTAAGNQANATGYIVADGAASNGNPLGGYIGVESAPNNGVYVVGCSTGDYSTTRSTTADPATQDSNGNNIIIGVDSKGLNHIPTGPPSGPCAPAPAPPTVP